MPTTDAAEVFARLKSSLPPALAFGLDGLAHAHGSEARCCALYLRATGEPPDVTAAISNIKKTLAFRSEHGFDDKFADDAALCHAFESHPLRGKFPFAFPGTAPDGCVILYAQLAPLDLPRLLGGASEVELLRFNALYLERFLRLQGDSTRARGVDCLGTYDIYDLEGGSTWTLLWEAKNHRQLLGRLLEMGEEHYPEQLCRTFVINAPPLFSGIWTLCKLFLSERTKYKVTISATVPPELVEALGGRAAVAKVRAALPA